MNVGDWITPDLELGGPDSGNGSGSGTSGASGSSGSSGSSGASGSNGNGGGKGGEATEPPTMPACIEEEQGSSSSCKDVGLWKQYASEACQSQGLELLSYEPREECGQELFRYVDYTCCPKAVPPSACTEEEQGSNSSCKDVGLWKQYASEACQSQGLELSSYEPREECGQELFRYVDYTCCPKAAPPSACIKEEQGSSSSCKDVGLWKQYASEACQSQGLEFLSYEPREECGQELFRYVDYTCCPKAAPPSGCIEEEQGSSSSCKDAWTWKQYAGEACQGQGLELSNYVPREECGQELFRYVDYTCCPLN